MELKSVLLKTLEERKSKNSSYSLRALARDMRLDAGQLNRIVNSKTPPSPLVAFKVGKYLKLNNDDIIQLLEKIFNE